MEYEDYEGQRGEFTVEDLKLFGCRIMHLKASSAIIQRQTEG